MNDHRFFNRLRAGVVLLGCCFGCQVVSIEAARWKNPAERYVDAHKKYLDAPIPIAEGDGIRHFVYFARDREA